MKSLLDYEVVHITDSVVNEQFDGVVIVGEDFNQENYPEAARPYVAAVECLAKVGQHFIGYSCIAKCFHK